MVNRLTKYTTLVLCSMGPNAPLPSKQVTQLLFQHIICKFGVPTSLMSDRDPRFISEVLRELWALLQYRVALSTVHHPLLAGQTKQMNCTVVHLLRSFLLTSDQSYLVSQIPFVEFEMNTTVSASIGFTPYELVFGVKARLPVDIIVATPATSDYSPSTFVQRCADLIVKSRLAMKSSQSAQKEQYNKYHSASSFEVGEQVLFSTQHLQMNGVCKLLLHWIRPFQILERVGTLSYHLKLPELYTQLHPVFHISKFKHYIADAVEQQEYVLPILTNKGLEYEIDHIIAQRGHGCNTHYLVRWVGYRPESDLWLSANDLVDAPLVL